MNILEEIMQDLEDLWRKAKKEKDEYKMLKYMNEMFKAIEKFTDFLERFGIKQKVADRIDIKEEKVSLSINMDMDQFKQIQELESRRV
jgi:alcohol dehydrogenase YqhD (iron-dependent ADH family)